MLLSPVGGALAVASLPRGEPSPATAMGASSSASSRQHRTEANARVQSTTHISLISRYNDVAPLWEEGGRNENERGSVRGLRTTFDVGGGSAAIGVPAELREAAELCMCSGITGGGGSFTFSGFGIVVWDLCRSS